MKEEENYPDDEYIDSENDPQKVEKITEEDYTIVEDKEEVVGFDKIEYSLESRDEKTIKRHDEVMESKVLESLKKGRFR